MSTGGDAAGVEVEWVDSHAHLQDAYLSGERGPEPVRAARATEIATPATPDPDELLRGALAAAAAGVRRIVCVGTGPQTSAGALALASRSAAGAWGPEVPQLWATAGLHPHDASEGTEGIIELLEIARGTAGTSGGTGVPAGSVPGAGRLVAVGECGLDYHYDHSPRDVQRRAFAEQVAVARRLGLALVIHARDAWEDLFDVLAGEGVPARTVLHCFTGGPDEARRCLDLGMYVSFSGIVTFKNAAEIRDAAAVCPLDRLLVETDSPFLAPMPHRGSANEPAYVPYVGEAIAAVKGVAPAVVAATSAEAAGAVFGL